jgi:hypothetical protein
LSEVFAASLLAMMYAHDVPSIRTVNL